jgi:hypothetical protein
MMESWARQFGEVHCRNLVERFSVSKESFPYFVMVPEELRTEVLAALERDMGAAWNQWFEDGNMIRFRQRGDAEALTFVLSLDPKRVGPDFAPGD